MISALSADIAGIAQTCGLGAVTPNIESGMELQVIAVAVIGGAIALAVLLAKSAFFVAASR